MAPLNNTDLFIVSRGNTQYKQPWSEISPALALPAGTVTLFLQSSAPTGWTQVTSVNDAGIYLVGSAGAGVLNSGGLNFSSMYTSTYSQNVPITTSGGASAGLTTVTEAQIPNHSHVYRAVSVFRVNGGGPYYDGDTRNPPPITGIQNNGGSGAHTHTLASSASSSVVTTTDFNVKYVDAIFCRKN